MMTFPVVSPTKDDRYMLDRPYRITPSLVIPAGYKTNGANIPRLLWFIVPPFKPKYLPAVIVHDFLCDKDRYKEADDMFEQMLLMQIEDSFRTRMMVRVVRLYHRVRYGVK